GGLGNGTDRRANYFDALRSSGVLPDPISSPVALSNDDISEQQSIDIGEIPRRRGYRLHRRATTHATQCLDHPTAARVRREHKVPKVAGISRQEAQEWPDV